MAHIEYFFSAHSAFAYLGSKRLRDIAERAGCEIAHKPIHLARVMAGVGVPAFDGRSEGHSRYFFGREIQRWAEYREVEWLQRAPTHHHRDYTVANRMLIAAEVLGSDVTTLAHALLQSHWRDDADLSDTKQLLRIAESVQIDAAPLLSAANSETVAERYEQNNREAIARSVFGSPTYFVDGDMFYGQDRLEFVELALKQSFSGSWPPE